MVREISTMGWFSLILVVGMLTGCSKGPPGESAKGGAREPTEDTAGGSTHWGDAPDFTLPKLGGGQFTLSSLKGKVIILDFWATWCPPCQREIPGFVSLHREFKDEGLEILGVALDKDGEAVVGPYAKKMGIEYPIVYGNRKVTESYGGIRSIPTTFVIDQNGNIKEKHVGFAAKEVFEKEVKTLLEAAK